MATPGYNGGLGKCRENSSPGGEVVSQALFLEAVILDGSHGTLTVPFALHYLPCHPVRGFCQDLTAESFHFVQ